MSTALAVLDLVNQLTHDEERNPILFFLLTETLNALNSSTKNYETYLYAFRLRLAAVFGYAPNFDVCSECGKPILIVDGEKQFAFQIARGALFCNKCCTPNSSGANYTDRNMAFTVLSATSLQIIRRLYHAQLISLGNLEYDRQIGNEIDELVRLYLQYHFDGLKPLKSTELFQQQHISAM